MKLSNHRAGGRITAGASPKNSDATLLAAVKKQVKVSVKPYHQGAYAGALPPQEKAVSIKE